MNVEKRNGSVVPWDGKRISNAILKAMRAGGKVSQAVAEKIAKEIEDELKAQKYELVTIHQIEDLVFKKLISHHHELTAKAYEGYRKIREFQRNNKNTTDEQLLSMLDGNSEYWTSENSNKNALLVTTKRDYMAGIVSQDLARRYLLPPDVIQANQEKIIKVHDMDYFAQHLTNCCLINLSDMLDYGTVINGVRIDQPHKLITAMTITTQIITAVSSSQYGILLED